ncbi:hypothetical protein D915_000535 [Fasciola hepatica]|uniref:Uncharacterized protein n=1 Tax=Fasciola hepatica TaxID=6192 RepID=A0A4E0RY45_FASHE|nr:hypothetical protein D915_000535 [Fasciola hepatica]
MIRHRKAGTPLLRLAVIFYIYSLIVNYKMCYNNQLPPLPFFFKFLQNSELWSHPAGLFFLLVWIQLRTIKHSNVKTD